MVQSKNLAIYCSNYILNHTPKAVMDVTPRKAFSKIKPDVSHLKKFGCKAWTHILNEKLKAMEPQTTLNFKVIF